MGWTAGAEGLSPLDGLLAGIPQKVKFTVTTGHYTVKNGDSLQLSNAEALLLLCPAGGRALVCSNSRGEGRHAPSLGPHPRLCPRACFPALHGGLRAAETLGLSLRLIP